MKNGRNVPHDSVLDEDSYLEEDKQSHEALSLEEWVDLGLDENAYSCLVGADKGYN